MWAFIFRLGLTFEGRSWCRFYYPGLHKRSGKLTVCVWTAGCQHHKPLSYCRTKETLCYECGINILQTLIFDTEGTTAPAAL